MSIINIIRKVINPFKLDLKIYPSLDLRRRKKLLEFYNINKILDVGANSGQYALEVFKLGFKGEIISLEPVKSVFKNLEIKTNNYKQWSALNYGLGDKEEQLQINISKNTFSSSLLDIMPNHIKSDSESKYTHKENVKIKRLDDISENLISKKDVVLLKIDVQGFEKNVIEGSKNSLKLIKGIQLEMSLEELYKGEMLFDETVSFLKSYGFHLHSLENGFYNLESGKLLQVDGLFFKS